jgi:hypothetical protein
MSTEILVNKSGVAVPLEVDTRNRLGVVNIDYVHEQIHDGNVWTFNYLDQDVDSGETIILKVVTGTKYFHFIFEAGLEAKAIVRTRSGGTYGAGTLPDGTTLTKFNRLSNSAKELLTVVSYAPTVTTAGTVRGLRAIYGGTGGTRVGSTTSAGRVESVIAPNTTFIIEVENTSGTSNNYGHIILDECYETTLAEL